LDFSARRRALIGALLDESDATPDEAPEPGEPGEPPLSFAQERLWFLDQYETDRPLYNIPVVVPLGRVEARVVRAALDEIVRRHAVLRTTFPVVDGRPVQRIGPPGPVDLQLVDLRGLAQAQREPAVDRIFIAERDYRFDLARGPLFRAILAALDDAHHALVLNVHHTVSDGWSTGVLLREFHALYEAFRAGRPSPLPELPLQYADFAREQRRELRGEKLAELLGYWRRKLDGMPPVVDLPTDRPRPKHQTFRGETQLFLIPKPVADALAELARESGVTMFMVLLAAFDLLLARYTGSQDVVLGTPIANRNRADIEPLIGFFVNTLVLRTDLSGDPTFRELLSRVREVTLEAYAHQDLPFEKLVEELQPERHLSHSPLIQAMFSLQNAPAMTGGAARGAYAVDRPTVVEGTAKFDLALFAGEYDNGIAAELEYNVDLFDRATATRTIAQLQRIVSAVAANPGLRVSEVSLVSEDEARRLARESAGAPAPADDRCLHELFEAQARRIPDTAAVLLAGTSLSYRELDERAERIARTLRASGVVPGTRVAISLERSLDVPATVLGVMKAGAACVPVDPAYPPARAAYMLQDSAATVIVTSANLRARFTTSNARTIVAGSDDDTGNAIAGAPGSASADDLAYVIYTSGSTGLPKGVAMPHRPVVNLVTWQARTDPLAPGARVLQFAALSFDVAFQEMFSTWSAGGTLVLVDEARRVDFDALAAYVAEHRVERVFLPPVALPGIAEALAALPPSRRTVREIVCAGEQLVIAPAVAAAIASLGAVVRNQYGPSETHVVTEYVLTGDPASWPATVPIGRPIDGVRAYVLDEALRPVPIGLSGELCAGGVAPARGYLDRAAATAERFVADPYGPPGARMYRTGDRVRRLADGTLVFLGRFDRQVKIRGYRVECGEIETALLQHPAVRQAAVVDYRDATGATALAAYVVADSEPPPSELRDQLAERLPEYMIPAAFMRLDALPLTPSGKLDRRALPVPGETTRERALVAPRSGLEAALASIWCEVLQRDAIGAEDGFFELGGRSLLATQVVSRVRREFDVELPLRVLFEAPSTVAELARAIVIERAGRAGEADAERILAEVERLSEREVEAALNA
jgi:amino acid adenylation domain-containing protein